MATVRIIGKGVDIQITVNDEIDREIVRLAIEMVERRESK